MNKLTFDEIFVLQNLLADCIDDYEIEGLYELSLLNSAHDKLFSELKKRSADATLVSIHFPLSNPIRSIYFGSDVVIKPVGVL